MVAMAGYLLPYFPSQGILCIQGTAERLDPRAVMSESDQLLKALGSWIPS